MPTGHFKSAFAGRPLPEDLADPAIVEIEYAVAQFAQKDVLYLAPLAQYAIALGAADEAELVGVLRNFQPDGVAGCAFKTEAMMPHDSYPQSRNQTSASGRSLRLVLVVA